MSRFYLFKGVCVCACVGVCVCVRWFSNPTFFILTYRRGLLVSSISALSTRRARQCQCSPRRARTMQVETIKTTTFNTQQSMIYCSFPNPLPIPHFPPLIISVTDTVLSLLRFFIYGYPQTIGINLSPPIR